MHSKHVTTEKLHKRFMNLKKEKKCLKRFPRFFCRAKKHLLQFHLFSVVRQCQVQKRFPFYAIKLHRIKEIILRPQGYLRRNPNESEFLFFNLKFIIHIMCSRWGQSLFICLSNMSEHVCHHFLLLLTLLD